MLHETSKTIACLQEVCNKYHLWKFKKKPVSFNNNKKKLWERFKLKSRYYTHIVSTGEAICSITESMFEMTRWKKKLWTYINYYKLRIWSEPI